MNCLTILDQVLHELDEREAKTASHGDIRLGVWDSGGTLVPGLWCRAVASYVCALIEGTNVRPGTRHRNAAPKWHCRLNVMSFYSCGVTAVCCGALTYIAIGVALVYFSRPKIINNR